MAENIFTGHNSHLLEKYVISILFENTELREKYIDRVIPNIFF